MHSRRFAAAFLTFLVAFAVSAYLLPQQFVHAEGAASGKQCPAEEKNKKEYQPARPWNTSYKEKRGDTVYTILNLFGKPCKDVTNEEVVTGHCIREDTCKADKTAEGKKPQTCLETKECPPGSNVGNTPGGADENEELPYFDEPKPDNSDGVLPLKEDPKPDTKTPAQRIDDGFKPLETITKSFMDSWIKDMQSIANPQAPKLEDSTMTGFGSQQMMQQVRDNGLPGNGVGQSLIDTAFKNYNPNASFGDPPPAPVPDTPAPAPQEQTWGQWFTEQTKKLGEYVFGPSPETPAVADAGGDAKETPVPTTPEQKDLTDPFYTEDPKPVDTTPKAEPFKNFGTAEFDENGLPVGGSDWLSKATADKIERLENDPNAEYYPDVKGDRERLERDLNDMEQRVKDYNKGPACAPSCTQQQVAAYQAKGEALRQEQSELLKSRDVYNELVKAERFEQQLSRPVTAEQLKPFTGPGPQTEAARNVFNAESAALREINQQQVNAFWNNKEVPQPDFVADQSRIANNVFEAADNKVTPEIQRQAYQDLTQIADARDQARIDAASARLDELNRKIAEMPVYNNEVDPFNGGMAFNQERLALEREAARLQTEVDAAYQRQETRETVREFLDDHPDGNRVGEMLLNNKNPAVERAAIDAMKGYMDEAEGYEKFLDGKTIDTRIRDQVDKNFWGLPTGNPFAVNGTDIAAQNNFNDQLYTTKMERYESQLSMLTGETPMSTDMQNKLDTLSGNYNGLYKSAYAVQDYLRDTYSLEGASEKPYYVLSAPAALLAAGIVDPLVGGTIGSREYFLSAPDNDLRENLSSWTGDLALTGVNAYMLPWARMAGAVGFEMRTFGEIASIGESVNAYTRVGSSLEPVFAGAGARTELGLAESVNGYTRVGSSLEPTFGNTAARAVTQGGFDAAAFAAARDIAPLEVNSFRPGAGLTAANDDFRTIVSANDNVLGGGPVGGGGARSIAAERDSIVAGGSALEGGGLVGEGKVTSLAAAREVRAMETGSFEGSAARQLDPFAGRGVTTVEGQAFQPKGFTTADAALTRGTNIANDNFAGGAAAPKTPVPATSPSTVPYGEFGYRPLPLTAPTWYQPADDTLYSTLSPSGNLVPSNPYLISNEGLNQFTPTPITPVSPVALSTGSPLPISPISPVSPVSPYVSPAAAPPKFVTPADYIRQTYGDAAGRAAREAQAYGASPFDWANYMGAGGGAGGAKDPGGAPSTPYPTTQYKPTAVIKPLRPPITQAPKAIAEVAVQALKEIGVIPGAVVETHPAQFPKELFDHDTNTYFQRLGDGRYLAQNFETGEVLTVPASDIGDLIDASRYDGNLEVAPGVFLKEPYRAETTFADAARGVVENGLGISATAQSLAERSGVTNGARPIASSRPLNPDVTPEQIPLVEIKNVPGSRDLRALDYPEALAIREFNSSLANYSKALASGAEITRASELVSNAYDDLLERGIFADEAGNLYRTESPRYPVAVPVSPQMAAQAAYAVVVPIDPMVREFVTGSTDETFAFDVPDLRILSSNFGVQPPITTDEAIILKRANDILETTRSRDSLLYLFDDSPLLIRPQDGYIVRPNGEVVARPEGTNPLPGALPDRFVPSGPVPPLPVQLVKINSSPTSNNRVRETYEAQDYQGRRIAAVEVTIDGAVAHVDSTRAYRPGEQTWTTRSNTLTPATIRSMLSQIKGAHPEVQAISGQRISGEQFAGKWDPADVGTSVEVPLTEVPSETIAASVPEVPAPVAVAPASRQLFDPLPIALALGLTFGSPIPMDAISDVIGDAARSFSNAAQARPQSRPGRPVERDLVRRDQAIADIGKVKKGRASWYGTGSNGGTNPSDVTASGALHRNDVNTVAMLGAAPKYPWGTVLMVKNVQKRLRSGAPNPAYGREIEVVVTSTGSQWNRDLDLSPKARDAIGIGAEGVIDVEYTVKYIPPLNQIGYWRGRTDLNNGIGALPKGTFDTQLAALRQNTQLAFGDTGFTNQPTTANTGINQPFSYIAPDLSSQISGNTAYRPIVIPSWQLPTPQLTVTPAEPLAANPTPAVERGTLADIPEPLAGNPVPRVERGADLPAPAQPSQQAPAPTTDQSYGGQPQPAAIQPNVPEIKTAPNPLDQSRFDKAISRTAEAIRNLDGQLLRDTAVKSFKKIAASIGLGPKEAPAVPAVKKAPFDAEAVPGSELSYVCGSSAACTEKSSDAVLVTAEPGRTFARIEAGDTPVNPKLGEAALPANDAKFLARAAGGFVTAGQGGKAVSQDITYSQGRLIGSKTINPNASQGLALTNNKGDGALVDKRAIPYGVFQKLGADIGTHAPGDVLDVTKDFAAFDKLMRDNELSAFSNLLLIKDGAIQNVVSSIAEPRRLLIQLQDGRLGILNSTKDQTMLGITQIAKALGARYAVNLDTGSFNEGRVAVQSGDAPYLGSTIKSQALTNIYLGIRNTPGPTEAGERIPEFSSPQTDAPFTGQPQPDAAPARAPSQPTPAPVESFGTNVRRPEFEESPAISPIASNDNSPRPMLGSPIPLSPIPNNRVLAAYVPPKANPGLSDFRQPTLYANSQGGIWPTVDGARQALVLDGEILPPAPIARSGSEVASPRPDLDLTANPNPSIAPTRVIGAPRPETVLDGEIIPPSPVGRSDSQVGEPKPVLDLQANKPGIAPTGNLETPAPPAPSNGLTAPLQMHRIAYTGSNALGEPKVVLNLDILGKKALVTMRSVDTVTIPTVEEIESLLRQLQARHPEVESFIASAPAPEQVIVMRDGSGDPITVTSIKQLPLSANSPVRSMVTVPIRDIPPGTTFTAPEGSILAYRWIKGDVDVDFFKGPAAREFDNPYFSSDLVSPLMYVMDSKNNIADPTANLIVIALPEQTFFDAAIYSLIESMRRPTNPDALNVMSRVNFPLTMHSGAAIPHEWLEAESDSSASLRRVEYVANYPGLLSKNEKSELYAALKKLTKLDTESAHTVFADIGKSLKEFSFDDLAAVEDYRVDDVRYGAHDAELTRLAGPFTDALSRIGTISRTAPGPETVPLPQNRSLVINRPPVNVLPALENILMTGPTLYVNAAGNVWPSLANAEVDMGIRNIVAQIRSEKIIDTGIRAIAQQVGAEKTIDDGIAQIAKQVGAEKVIDDGIAQIAWQVSTQKKIDDAMKAIVSPERAIDDGIADIVSRIQPGTGAAPVQSARTSVPQVPSPRFAEVPVTPERMLEDAIRDFAGAPAEPPVARTSPRPDVSVPPPLPSRPFMERAKDIWSDTKLVARISRGVVFPASTVRRNVGVNVLNMIVAYNLTGPYTVLTWPALNVGWRYVFNKDYRADINNVASRVRSALADARATRDAARAAEELLTPSTPRASVPQVRPTVAQAETPLSIEDGIRDIVSNVRTNPTPETIIDEGIADIASNVRGTPPSPANDLGKTVAQFAADHPSLTKGAPEVQQQPRATDPLTQTVTEFAADKPKIAETSLWDNFLEWIKFGGGGGRGGGTSGGDGTDEPESNAEAVKRGLLSIARLIPGLSSLINALPPTNPTPTDAPLKGSPQTAQKTTPVPDKKPVVATPPSQKQPPAQPATKQPPVPPPSGPVPPPNPVPDTNPRPDSAPTGGTNGGGGLGSLSSLLSGLMKGLGLGQPKPTQPAPQQPLPNGGIVVQMSAQPNPVTPGQTVLVSWTSVNATTCNAFNASSTKVASGVPGAMFQVQNVTATTSFKVFCSNALGQYASATVQILMK